MNFQNIVAVVMGIVIGSVVNGGLVALGHVVVPPPEGFDPATMETFKATFHLLGPKDMIFPFLAHALGTLVGATVAYVVAGSRKMVLGMVIGAFFLMGGIAMVVMVGGPVWFVVLDLGVAYIPMAWLGCRIGEKLSPAMASDSAGGAADEEASTGGAGS